MELPEQHRPSVGRDLTTVQGRGADRCAPRRRGRHHRRGPGKNDQRRSRQQIGNEVLPADSAVLVCQDLSHHVDDHPVLRRVSFEIRPGQVYALTGPPGSGKTTLVSAICGLLSPTCGSVLLRGRPVDRLDQETLSRSIGYVRRSVATGPSISVAGTLQFWGRLSGLSRSAAQERTVEVLRRMHLDDQAERPFESCDSGVQRELTLAVALLRRPALLVLDEPCRGADLPTRDRLVSTLRSLRDDGMAILYTSRDVDQARRVGDHVGELRDGWLSWQSCSEQQSAAA